MATAADKGSDDAHAARNINFLSTSKSSSSSAEINHIREHLLGTHSNNHSEKQLDTKPEKKSHISEVESSASHFLNSVFSVAKDAASWVKPTSGDDTASSSFLVTERDNSDSSSVTSRPNPVSDVIIQPIRSTISTLGRGELSLDSLDARHRGRRTSRELPRSSSAQISLLKEPNEHGGISSSQSTHFPLHHKDDSASNSVDKGDEEFATPDFHHAHPRNQSNAPSSSTVQEEGADISRSGSSRPRSRSHGPNRRSIERNESNVSSISKPKTNGDASMDKQDDPAERSLAKKRNNTNKSRGSAKGHISGFAFADKKRNTEFHKIFRSIQSSDYLLDDFSCALSRDILVQGRLYVSERNLCFNSNILGWVTNLIIAFDEIVSLEKKSTAGLFPNGIVVQTLHARHSFASFVSRDSTFEFLKSIWKQMGVYKNQRANDSQLLSDSFEDDFDGSTDGYDSDEYDESGTEDEYESDNDMTAEETKRRKSSFGDVDSEDSSFSSDESISDVSSTDEFEGSARKNSESKEANGQANGGNESGGADTGGDGESDTKWPVANLGPDTHEPTKVPSPANDNEKVLFSDTINAPLGVVVNLVYGQDTTWYFKFLTEKMKNTELASMPKLTDKTRKYDYIKPLNSTVGPKSTKCICTETVEKWDLNDLVSVVQVTQTPNVPSGNSFLTKSRTILSWDTNNNTKITCSYWIEWSSKSWLKGPIEKGAEDGQVQSAKELIAELNSAVKPAAPGKRQPSGSGRKRPSKKKRKGKKSDEVSEPQNAAAAAAPGATSALGQVYSTIAGLLGSFDVKIWIIVIFFVGAALGRLLVMPSHSHKDLETERLQLLKVGQEYELWKWIDDRGGKNEAKPRGSLSNEEGAQLYNRQQLDEMIKITEHRLQSLKEKLSEG